MVQTNLPNRLTVLLANEQEGWHQTVRGLLEPQGVQTVAARSGREALGMHVFSVLSKPVDFNLLLDALARVLRRYHQGQWPEVR